MSDDTFTIYTYGSMIVFSKDVMKLHTMEQLRKIWEDWLEDQSTENEAKVKSSLGYIHNPHGPAVLDYSTGWVFYFYKGELILQCQNGKGDDAEYFSKLKDRHNKDFNTKLLDII